MNYKDEDIMVNVKEDEIYIDVRIRDVDVRNYKMVIEVVLKEIVIYIDKD